MLCLTAAVGSAGFLDAAALSSRIARPVRAVRPQIKSVQTEAPLTSDEKVKAPSKVGLPTTAPLSLAADHMHLVSCRNVSMFASTTSGTT